MAQSKATAPGMLVVDTNENDIVLGRGKNANNRAGNVRFRKLVQAESSRYHACESAEEKTAVAESVISQVQARGGRFLAAVTAGDSRGKLIAAWEVSTAERALAKTKQALRDSLPRAKRKRISSAPPKSPSQHPRYGLDLGTSLGKPVVARTVRNLLAKLTFWIFESCRR